MNKNIKLYLAFFLLANCMHKNIFTMQKLSAQAQIKKIINKDELKNQIKELEYKRDVKQQDLSVVEKVKLIDLQNALKKLENNNNQLNKSGIKLAQGEIKKQFDSMLQNELTVKIPIFDNFSKEENNILNQDNIVGFFVFLFANKEQSNSINEINNPLINFAFNLFKEINKKNQNQDLQILQNNKILNNNNKIQKIKNLQLIQNLILKNNISKNQNLIFSNNAKINKNNIKKLKEKSDFFAKKLQESKQRIERLENSLDESKSEYFNLTYERDFLLLKNKSLISDNNDFKQKYEQKSQELIIKNNNKIKELQNDNNNLIQNYDNLEQNYDNLEQQSQQRSQEIQRKNDIMQILKAAARQYSKDVAFAAKLEVDNKKQYNGLVYNLIQNQQIQQGISADYKILIAESLKKIKKLEDLKIKSFFPNEQVPESTIEAFIKLNEKIVNLQQINTEINVQLEEYAYLNNFTVDIDNLNLNNIF